ncbi:protein belonging to uncharacterized protein family UPF0145 [Rhodopirellula baltica SH28]|uniref:UPF0145 protein RBSH_02708 n=1 Tax=Rhodopirellula baltica SH28 TaxID=993517 RepID=K5CE40_RHOBT|nr:protein belonging to uncharacterized protein family UPF0145 [Rhodopirellula baltica SH28]
MPWKCPACGGTTELGYNVCRKCGAARPGSDPDEINFQIEMPMTTTSTFETHTIEAYRGPVFGETIYGANVLRDISAVFTDVVGGRAGDYEKVLIRGRNAALAEMSERAKQLGANAVIGIRFDYSTVGRSMLMICSSGTAVIANPRIPDASH